MIYLDNAATTYPKPEEVYQKIDWANRNIAINAGRGSYKAAQEASRLIEETRRQRLELVGSSCFDILVISSSVGLKYNLKAACINLTTSSSASTFNDCVANQADQPNFLPSVRIALLGEFSL